MSNLSLSSKKLVGHNCYHNYLSATAREKLAEAKRIEEDLDMRGEIHLLRMKMMEALQSDEPSTKELLELNKELRQTITAMSGMIDKLAGYIPVSMLEVIYTQVVQVIQANVKDSNVLQRVTQQLGRVRVPANQSEADRLDREIAQGNVSS